jgi:hypothetical protein
MGMGSVTNFLIFSFVCFTSLFARLGNHDDSHDNDWDGKHGK